MPRRILEGEVVSDKTDKTVTVLVERRMMHPMYKKIVRKTSKYAAHDEANAFKMGDRVQIEECRPISKRKRWTVITKPGPNAGRPKRETAKQKEAVKEEAAKKAKAEAKKAEKEAKEAKKTEAKKKAPAKKAAPKKTAAKKAPAKKAAPKKEAAKKKTTSKKKDEDK